MHSHTWDGIRGFSVGRSGGERWRRGIKHYMNPVEPKHYEPLEPKHNHCWTQALLKDAKDSMTRGHKFGGYHPIVSLVSITKEQIYMKNVGHYYNYYVITSSGWASVLRWSSIWLMRVPTKTATLFTNFGSPAYKLSLESTERRGEKLHVTLTDLHWYFVSSNLYVAL